METIFTKRLLGTLIRKHYLYYLSKTNLNRQGETGISITLKPVKKLPRFQQLPGAYQRFYHISQELLDMAAGIPGTQILLDMSGVEIETALY
jgi:hypothetical protein